MIRQGCRGAFEHLGEDPSYRGDNVVLLCPEPQGTPSKDILLATNLFRFKPSQQCVRIQAKTVLQNVASSISSWTGRHGTNKLSYANRLAWSLEATDHEDDEEEEAYEEASVAGSEAPDSRPE